MGTHLHVIALMRTLTFVTSRACALVVSLLGPSDLKGAIIYFDLPLAKLQACLVWHVRHSQRSKSAVRKKLTKAENKYFHSGLGNGYKTHISGRGV